MPERNCLGLCAYEVAEYPRQRRGVARRLLSWSLTAFTLVSLLGCFRGH